MPVGNVENLKGLDLELGCYTGSLQTTYLGLPLGVRHNFANIWNWVEERFPKRLALWKEHCVLEGGSDARLPWTDTTHNRIVIGSFYHHV